MKKIGVMMGSDSDLPVVKKAINTLAEFEVPYEVHIYSAHRTPVQAHEFAANARENGFGAIICAAGMAAHLAGVNGSQICGGKRAGSGPSVYPRPFRRHGRSPD